jgi:biopolymer transport protein ExbD
VAFVKGDPTLPFSDVAEVIDIARGAGIDKIGLVTKALEEGQ